MSSARADTVKDLEVTESGAVIYAEPSAQSAVVTKVKVGQRLQALTEKAGFYQLKTKSGKPMWVSIRQVQAVQDTIADLERAKPRAVGRLHKSTIRVSPLMSAARREQIISARSMNCRVG